MATQWDLTQPTRFGPLELDTDSVSCSRIYGAEIPRISEAVAPRSVDSKRVGDYVPSFVARSRLACFKVREEAWKAVACSLPLSL